MQWSGEPNAGFTTGKPWLPLGSEYRRVNVAVQREDPRSVLALHKALIKLRRAEPALQLGRLQLLEPAGDVLADVLTYLREDRFLIALNIGSTPQRIGLPRAGAIVLSTHLDRAEERVAGTLQLRPDEGVVVRLEVP